MFLAQRIGHSRNLHDQTRNINYRGPGAVGRLEHRLTRWLQRQAGRPWADVQVELDEKLRRAEESADVRRQARHNILKKLGRSNLWLHIDRTTGRLAWDRTSRKRREPVTYSVHELQEGRR